MSSIHAQDSSFLGGRIPPEIESLSKNLKDVDQEMFRKMLKGTDSELDNAAPIFSLIEL